MKTIGIISVPEKKVIIGRKFLRPIIIKEKFGKNNKYVAAELSYTAEEITRMSTRRLHRVVRRAEKILFCEGAENVLFAKNLRNLPPVQKVYKEYALKTSKKIPPSKVVDCYLYALEKFKCSCKTRLPERAMLCDRRLLGMSFEKLSRICMDVKHITLRTGETKRGEKLANSLFEEYGILISVEAYDKSCDVNAAQVVIDVDEGRIRINDFVVDGAEYVSNSGIYGLEPAEEAACLGDECDLDVRYLMSGENVLYFKEKNNKIF